VRDDIGRAYRAAHAATGDTAAFIAAAARFTASAGRTPTRAELEALLRDGMLVDDHPLLQLLQAAAPARRKGDLKPSAPRR